MCSNSVGDEGLCALADALHTNTTLNRVAIWGNKIGEPTCNVSLNNSAYWGMYVLGERNLLSYLKNLITEKLCWSKNGCIALQRSLQNSLALGLSSNNSFSLNVVRCIMLLALLMYFSNTQAFRELLESRRLLPNFVDVKHYEVDGITYLARTDMK